MGMRPSAATIELKIGYAVNRCLHGLQPERGRRRFEWLQVDRRVRRRCRIEQHGNAGDAGRDLLEQLHPFAGNRRLHDRKPGGVAAGPGEALDKPAPDRIGNDDKHDGNGARLLQHRARRRRVLRENDLGPQRKQFFCRSLSPCRIIERTPAEIDVDIESFTPPELLEFVTERGDEGLKFHVVLGMRHEDPDPPDRLLCARRKRPRCQCAAH